MKGFHIQSNTVGGAEVISFSSATLPLARLISQVSIDMGKGKGKGFSRIAKLVTASARDQQTSLQVTMTMLTLMVAVMMVVVVAAVVEMMVVMVVLMMVPAVLTMVTMMMKVVVVVQKDENYKVLK